MHFRAFRKPKPKATKFIDYIWFWLFTLCVYIVHFIVSTEKGEQPGKPKQGPRQRHLSTSPCGKDKMVLRSRETFVYTQEPSRLLCAPERKWVWKS